MSASRTVGTVRRTPPSTGGAVAGAAVSSKSFEIASTSRSCNICAQLLGLPWPSHANSKQLTTTPRSTAGSPFIRNVVEDVFHWIEDAASKGKDTNGGVVICGCLDSPRVCARRGLERSGERTSPAAEGAGAARDAPASSTTGLTSAHGSTSGRSHTIHTARFERGPRAPYHAA